MSFKHLLLVVGVCAVVAGAVAVAQDGDYFEEEEVKPAPPPRSSLLNRRPGILSRGKPSPATPSTTTPQPKEIPPPEDELPEDDFSQEGEEEGQDEITTTPASKKLKTGVVRPFRSNDDLLAALKRRRAEAANGKSNHHAEANNADVSKSETATESHSAPSNKANNQVGRRAFAQRAKSEPSPPPAEEGTTQSPKTRGSRNRFSGRGLYKSASNDNVEIAGLESSQQIVEVKPRAGFKPGQRRF
ncbi:uncharacterized protein LOC143922239 [Arctopsyche grandis]|uniref:uncharacterized protein LOC143922239 n=1 Tax=Arctopsyche grandis TaxID=121162 RepID=UPI00406D8FDA